MSKKLILSVTFALIFILALGSGAYWWFFLRGSSRRIAECLPENTLIYASFPDLTQTAIRYQASDLKQFVGNKEVQALAGFTFLKIIQNMPQDSRNSSAVIQKITTSLLECISGETFIALTHLEPGWKPAKLGVIFGTHSSFKKDKFESFIKTWDEVCTEKFPDSPKGEGDVNGIKYRWWGNTKEQVEPKLCAAAFDGWQIIAISESDLRLFIERYKNPHSKESSLASNIYYNEMLSNFKEQQDFILYSNLGEAGKSAVQLLDSVADSSKFSANSSSEQSHRKLLNQSLLMYRWGGWGMRFNGSKLAERMAVSFAKNERAEKILSIHLPCDGKAMKFTGKDTLYSVSASMNLKNYYDFLMETYAEVGLPVDNWKLQIQEKLASVGLDLEKNFLSALGPEISFQLDWPDQVPFPSVSLFVEVKSVENFKPVQERLEQMIPALAASTGMLSLSEKAQNGAKILSVSSPMNPAISPALAMGNDFISLHLLEPMAERKLAYDGKESILLRPDSKKFFGDKISENSTVLYCNTPLLIERTYAALRKLSSFSATSKIFPLSFDKLPDSLTFQKHMGELYLKTRRENNVVYVEAESGVGSQIIPLCLGFVAFGAALPPRQHTQDNSPASSAPQKENVPAQLDAN